MAQRYFVKFEQSSRQRHSVRRLHSRWHPRQTEILLCLGWFSAGSRSGE